jgi:hypothetical protein
VAALLRANVETLDVPYLRSWAGRLRLETSLQAVWTEALPGRLLRG